MPKSTLASKKHTTAGGGFGEKSFGNSLVTSESLTTDISKFY